MKATPRCQAKPARAGRPQEDPRTRQWAIKEETQIKTKRTIPTRAEEERTQLVEAEEAVGGTRARAEEDEEGGVVSRPINR